MKKIQTTGLPRYFYVVKPKEESKKPKLQNPAICQLKTNGELKDIDRKKKILITTSSAFPILLPAVYYLKRLCSLTLSTSPNNENISSW